MVILYMNYIMVKALLKNINDILIFEGEYLNGKRNGKGKEYKRSYFYNSKPNLIFEGEHLNGKWWNGKGYDGNNNISFEIKDGKGFIKEYDLNGTLKFEGEYVNGERNGKGKRYYKEYNYEENSGYYAYEGEYLHGKKMEKGKNIINFQIFLIKYH